MDPIQPQAPEAAPKKNLGTIIGIVVVIILIVIVALYFWGEKISMKNGSSAATSVETTTQVATEQAPSNNTSDEVSALDAELSGSGSTNIDLSGL